jgi:transcriptional regulator with XRE-family HTH domain
MVSPKDSLISTIRAIKALGKDQGLTISEAEMARKIGLSKEQLEYYITGNMETPDDLTHRLLTGYDYLFEAARRRNNNAIILSTVALIKERSAAEGITITEEEMADKIGIPMALFNPYLAGDIRPSDDIVIDPLRAAYKQVLKNIQFIRIVQEVHAPTSPSPIYPIHVQKF